MWLPVTAVAAREGAPLEAAVNPAPTSHKDNHPFMNAGVPCFPGKRLATVAEWQLA